MSAAAPGGGMLAIWHDVAEGQLAAVRKWYAREHHFERLAIEGFLEARRLERVSGEGGFMLGLYRVAFPAVLASPAYRAAVGTPSEWTRATMPNFRAMCRTVCRIDATAGGAEGGHVMAFAAAQGRLADAQSACDRVLALDGVLRVQAIAAVDAEPAAAGSTEVALRGGPDGRIAWALLADTDTAEAAETALQAARDLAAGEPARHAGVWRLAFAARNPR